MIAGGGAFLLFWGGGLLSKSTAVGLDLPWAIALCLHGVVIVGLSIGLIAHARKSDASGPIRLLTWAGVGATVAGLLTVQPLIFAGLGLVGLSAVLERRPSNGGAALLVGSVLGLVAYATGVRPGEGAPALTGTQQAMTAVSVLAISAGCMLIGFARLRTEPVHPA